LETEENSGQLEETFSHVPNLGFIGMMLKNGMNVPNIPASFHFMCEKNFPRFTDFGMKSAQLREKVRFATRKEHARWS